MSKSTTEIFEDHLHRRVKGDVEGDIRANFDSDVVILSSFGTYRGHDGVRESASKLAKMVGEAEFIYNQTIVEGDYALLEWTATSKDVAVCDGADSFVVRDGKIIM